jgi:TIGR03009 family protein
MRRIGQAARIFALAVLASGLGSASADNNPKPSPQASDPVDRVLEEWQRKAATIKSVDVKFQRTDYYPRWGQSCQEGRAIMASPNLASVEYSPVGDDGKATVIKERMIWYGRSIYQFDMEYQRVFRISLKEEWPAPPSLLRLPFFFQMHMEQAKREFIWQLVKEDEKSIILKVIPKGDSDRSQSFSSCRIELEKKTFHPTKMMVWAVNNRDYQEFKPIDIKINTVQDTSELTNPCLDAWKVIAAEGVEWPFRLFPK